MVKRKVLATIVVGLVATVIGPAPEVPAQDREQPIRGPLILLNEQDISWKEGPDSLPKGAEWAVIEGDPMKPGPYTMRLRFPAHYTIPPHTHPVIEHVTVLSGWLHVGLGKTLDRGDGRVLSPPAGFAAIPAGQAHFAWTTDGPVEVQLHGTGPWGITYVNPSDDPRNSAK